MARARTRAQPWGPLFVSVVLCVLVTVPLPAGAGPAPSFGTRAAPHAAGQDWLTWGYDTERTGYNPNETILGPSTVPNLHPLWTFPFALKSDNAPVLASDVDVDGQSTDLIYAGDRTGTFHAIDADTGVELWSRQLGTNVTCAGDLGVTGTAVIDRSRGALYVAGGDGKLYALDLATGTDEPGWPLPITMFPNEYVWSAITEFDGSLYVSIASGCDGLGTNYGRVVRVDPDAIAQTAVFYVTGGPDTGVSGGGIWGWGGVSIDPADGNVYAATANGYPNKEYEHYLYSEHVVRLTPDLSVVSSNYPGLKGFDVDFGTTPVLYKAGHGCGEQLLVESKTGKIFNYDRNHVHRGPVDRQLLASTNLIGVAAYDPADRLVFVGNPSDSADGTYPHGLLAFRIAKNCSLHLAWNHPVGAGIESSPVIANGVVYFGDGSAGRLLALDVATHKKLWSSGHAFTSSVQTEPIVVGGRVYVTTGSALYAFGL